MLVCTVFGYGKAIEEHVESRDLCTLNYSELHFCCSSAELSTKSNFILGLFYKENSPIPLDMEIECETGDGRGINGLPDVWLLSNFPYFLGPKLRLFLLTV